MHDACGHASGGEARSEHVHAVAVGLPDVQLHRNLPLIRKLQLAVENLFLYLAGGEIVVIVQADLPQQAALRVVQVCKDDRFGGGIVAAGVVGMGPDGCAEEVVMLTRENTFS